MGTSGLLLFVCVLGCPRRSEKAFKVGRIYAVIRTLLSSDPDQEFVSEIAFQGRLKGLPRVLI